MVFGCSDDSFVQFAIQMDYPKYEDIQAINRNKIISKNGIPPL